MVVIHSMCVRCHQVVSNLWINELQNIIRSMSGIKWCNQTWETHYRDTNLHSSCHSVHKLKKQHGSSLSIILSWLYAKECFLRVNSISIVNNNDDAFQYWMAIRWQLMVPTSYLYGLRMLLTWYTQFRYVAFCFGEKNLCGNKADLEQKWRGGGDQPFLP